MKLSMMAACAENGVIGNGPDIPWQAKGEQLLFKALTYNQWLMVGRKTFDSMGRLPNRKYAVISRTAEIETDENLKIFRSIEDALEQMKEITDHLYVAGGGQLYAAMIDKIDTLHLSVIHTEPEGDVTFPTSFTGMTKVFEQHFESNVDYSYQIWQRE